MTPRHTLMALLVVVIWGLNFLAIDFGLEGVPPLLFLALRFTVVVIPAIFFLKPPDIGWRNILLIGGFLSLGQFSLLYIALQLGMPPGLASLLHQSQVVLTVIVSVIVLRERPSRRQLTGIIVGMTGLAIVVVGHGQAAPWLPVVILLLGSLSWAIGNVLSRAAKATSSLSLVVWSGLVVPIPAFLLSLVFDSPPVVFDALAHLSWTAILSTLYTAVGASLIGYGIWNHLLARYPTSAVVPFTLLVPIVGILAAWLVVNEQPTLSEVIGGAVMLVGLAIAVVVFRPRQPGSASLGLPLAERDHVHAVAAADAAEALGSVARQVDEQPLAVVGLADAQAPLLAGADRRRSAPSRSRRGCARRAAHRARWRAGASRGRRAWPDRGARGRRPASR